MTTQVTPAVAIAWQSALAAEQQAAFGYALLGPHLPAGQRDLARSCQALHEQVRDRTAGHIAASGGTPAAPQGDYPGLYGTRPLSLAARLEDDCAAAWRYFYLVLARSAGSPASLRATAQAQLTDSALRATRWRLRSNSPRPVVAFPGSAVQK